MVASALHRLEACYLRQKSSGAAVVVSLMEAVCDDAVVLLLYALLFRGRILSGRAGFLYVLQRMVAERLIASYLAAAAWPAAEPAENTTAKSNERA